MNSILKQERERIRELAKLQLEYANLPVMRQRERQWKLHNSLKGERPMIIMETNTFYGDLVDGVKCTTPEAQGIEISLICNIRNHELVDDDKVVPDYFPVDTQVYCKDFGIDAQVEHSTDAKGRNLGYAVHYPIKDLDRDISLLKPFKFGVAKEAAQKRFDLIQDLMGDILPARFENYSLLWAVTPTAKVVWAMGTEQMMLSMYDYPERFHELMELITQNIIDYICWQQKEGLLTLNNANHYAGAGSLGFTQELPASDFKGIVRPKDMWLNINSQESTGLSPAMFGEFIYPYYKRICEHFGLVYFGCCEAVHPLWDKYIKNLPNLRKVSISKWCDELHMGRALAGSNVIYSRKPDPNFLGVGAAFDEQGFGAHIKKTMDASLGCKSEIIFRDVYTLNGNREKVKRAVEITRRLTEDQYGRA